MPWNGLESAKQVHLLGKASFPDMQVTTEDLIAEGDKVVERWTQTQTHSGAPFMGIPPSNKPITFTGISIYRIANGRIVEHWANMDLFGMMAQMGAIPAPGM
jgi:predicted ester cyclase